ncbi:MAG: amino acid ABC transporter substrate-binding protein [Alphaproteobacteria bacterium]|nr:amino acid ABC transporter substrate-binding protein [Alphaproteobacteria bacterium]MBU1551330.1 amino acid ABC transporter substrate-binding protein [Alphaproteobacteria bacterium]MBU2334735.1 amino acid ABC transporter substrate-binding protein [Alphaproteobacteria bacterium]MBU2389238.1 amino acid ABC transporter substrate-binding protein [Alphaproteobacteria bacterium]
MEDRRVESPRRRGARHRIFGLAAATLLVCHPWPAIAAEGVLARIAETKTIAIGHREDAVPFSYRGPDGTVIGYSTELCQRIAERIRVELGLDELKVTYVPSSAATRFVLVKSGAVDLECTTTTNTPERRKLVDFSYPHFITATRFVSKKKDGLETIQSLAGRSVASTTGTVNIEQLQALNRAKSLNISVMLAKAHTQAFALVEAGRASAFVMDGILLAALVASSADPQAYTISTETFGPPEPYGILLPKDDEAFRAVVDAALEEVYTSGEIFGIYDKWFNAPIPPHGQNLNLPISAELQAVFDNPKAYHH